MEVTSMLKVLSMMMIFVLYSTLMQLQVRQCSASPRSCKLLSLTFLLYVSISGCAWKHTIKVENLISILHPQFCITACTEDRVYALL